jgi:threonine 3-dehydrogenase
MYGVSKVYAELLGEYYHTRFGLDFRTLRYPGILSVGAVPGGGTTDYLVQIYYDAVEGKISESFLTADGKLPIMFLPDAIKATVALLECPEEKLTERTYNVSAMSLSVEDVAASIRKVIPGLQVTYKPDFRAKIAATWPNSINFDAAMRDWDWKPEYDLDRMTQEMIDGLRAKLAK